MLNKSKIHLLSLLSMAILFASCGSMEFEKRYHQGGFHLSFRKEGKNEQSIIRKSGQKKHIKVRKTEESYSEQAETEVGATLTEIFDNSTSISLQAKQEVNDDSKRSFHLKKIPVAKQLSIATQRINNNSNTKKVNSNSTKDVPEGDIMFILYFILCLVIPPLAYYLIKEQTDNWFWVCFLCFLLALSWLTGFSYGLLGIASVVIAILALLNKI